MYGAILGDIVGSPYEFDCNNYTCFLNDHSDMSRMKKQAS